ncbi:MAG TPA: aminotransferase class I/II-fold pyridoxal phosphate-dependent enzyme [Vicinamibacterales bacterium]|jgi:aspartate/methionine/tyrosine aminotransferase|nr:aminotransferase class I/II-fold pyridoxal phosphate-dependent enzyme [Vicinamibacterales bacterium]
MIEPFAMERMQSTWENLVDYDMSESGVRPLTMRELVEMGFDLDSFMDQPLGYSQSNGTIELREAIAAIYSGASVDHIEVTNGTSEANYLVALSQLRPGDDVAMELPNYMQMPGVARSLGATVRPFRLVQQSGWEPDWDQFERAVTPKTKLLYLSNPNNPTGAVLSDAAMRRIVERCEATGTWILADEVYLGAEIDRPRTESFWGMSDRVIVTSGLSKAYGIPGVRIGWIVGPTALVAECWTQHDYLTIGPNKLSDRIARVAVQAANRERCYARTREILSHNLPIARTWVDGFGGRLTWREPQAGAIALLKYDADVPSLQIAERVRVNQSTLIVPGSHVGLEGHLRVWLGGKEPFLREGLRRIGEELKPLFD